MKAIWTLSPYSFSICLRVGPTLAQKGHWKSENSTILTLAVWAPLMGDPLVLTL